MKFKGQSDLLANMLASMFAYEYSALTFISLTQPCYQNVTLMPSVKLPSTKIGYFVIKRKYSVVLMRIISAFSKYYTRNWVPFKKMYEETADTFLYFAYGSNLLKRRIRINNASAEFIGIGRLEDHQLDFIKYSDHWRGASATIVPTEGSHVWGAIWRLNVADMPALDKQEGVDTNWYFAKTIDVITPDGFKVKCRTYEQTENPLPRQPGEELPMERRPCITYLDCIINGAKECELPPSYIEELKKIPHNGQEASPKMIEKLNRTC